MLCTFLGDPIPPWFDVLVEFVSFKLTSIDPSSAMSIPSKDRFVARFFELPFSSFSPVWSHLVPSPTMPNDRYSYTFLLDEGGQKTGGSENRGAFFDYIVPDTNLSDLIKTLMSFERFCASNQRLFPELGHGISERPSFMTRLDSLKPIEPFPAKVIRCSVLKACTRAIALRLLCTCWDHDDEEQGDGGFVWLFFLLFFWLKSKTWWQWHCIQMMT